MKYVGKISLLTLVLTTLIYSNLFSQYSEELVEIKYETNELVSIKTLTGIDYISQMLGGVTINSDDNSYIFTDEGDGNKLYTLDILTGEILYQVEVPQIQMIQYIGTDELVGLTKMNPSNIVSLSSYNYKTGEISSFSPIAALEGVVIDTHNSAVDVERNIFYFVGSLAGTNVWSLIAIDYATGELIKTIAINPAGEFLAAIAFDKERNKILGLLNVTENGKSLVEINPDDESITEIKKIPELINTFGGHRYWAYDDLKDRFFIIGLDNTNESYLYVLNSNTGEILFQNIYEDDAWIMEEHSPLELRFNPSTNQLLGLRKGEPLPTVSIAKIENNSEIVKIFPNPISKGLMNVELLNEEKIAEVQIVDNFGSLHYRKDVANSSKTQLTINDLVAGMYYVIIKTEKGVVYQRFLKL